VTGGS
jgi:hypothetical protein